MTPEQNPTASEPVETKPAQPVHDQAHYIAMDLIQSRIVDSRFYHAVCLQVRARQMRDAETAKAEAAASSPGLLSKLFSPAKPK